MGTDGDIARRRGDGVHVARRSFDVAAVDVDFDLGFIRNARHGDELLSRERNRKGFSGFRKLGFRKQRSEKHKKGAQIVWRETQKDGFRFPPIIFC